mgnify:CR=1 FL=1
MKETFTPAEVSLITFESQDSVTASNTIHVEQPLD